MKQIILPGLILASLAGTTPAHAESTCYGTTSNGRIEDAVQLPLSGKNYRAYGDLPVSMGRTWVHSQVHDILLAAYKELENRFPNTTFIYGEIGLENGGPFNPHKTHQNGLSVDLMVPIIDMRDGPTEMSTHIFNRYGYDNDYDSNGRDGDEHIDFDALGALILALQNAAEAQEVTLWRVIFAPDLQDELYATRFGEEIRRRITIPTKRSWVRHDDHIHVDFEIPCKPLTN